MIKKQSTKALCILFCIIGFIPNFAFPEHSIVVFDFENQSNYFSSWLPGETAADILSETLDQKAKLEVYTRQELANKQSWSDTPYPHLLSVAKAAELGRMLDVDFVVIGSVKKLTSDNDEPSKNKIKVVKRRYNAEVEVKVVHSQSSKLILKLSESAYKRESNLNIFGFGEGNKNALKHEQGVLQKAIEKTAKKIASADLHNSSSSHLTMTSSLSNKTLVARVDDNSITLNQGYSAGIMLGEKYDVLRPVGTIKNPTSGKVLKMKYAKQGQILITKVSMAFSEGKLISNKGVQEGDQLERSTE